MTIIDVVHALRAENEALKNTRDAALADLSQAREERNNTLYREKTFKEAYDAAVKRAEDSFKRALQEEERANKFESELTGEQVENERLREENARLKVKCEARLTVAVESDREVERYQALLGRAVSLLQRMQYRKAIDLPRLLVDDWRLIDAILADATATRAADAWRTQQEEREELEAIARTMQCGICKAYKTLPDSIDYHGFAQRPCETPTLSRLFAKIDARRASGKGWCEVSALDETETLKNACPSCGGDVERWYIDGGCNGGPSYAGFTCKGVCKREWSPNEWVDARRGQGESR